MTASTFRRLALELPDVVEKSHMDHPDFRVGGKIFATLDFPSKGWGMVVLTPAEQARVVKAYPGVFVPAAGAWGRRGATHAKLRGAQVAILRRLLLIAWRKRAPSYLVDEPDLD
jgi:hypothetical protein